MSNGRQTLLWVQDGTTSDAQQLETVCRELGISLRLCGHGDLSTTQVDGASLIGLALPHGEGPATSPLKSLRERHPDIPVFVASADASVSAMKSALQAGATDFLGLPLNPLDLSRVLIRLASDTSRAPQKVAGGEIITIHGCRGGLGATTFAVNLGIRLEGLGRGEVAVVDLDLQRGDVSAFLNLTPSQSIASLAEARGEIDEIFLHSAMTRHPSGMFVLAAPEKIEDGDSVGHDEVTHALRLLRTQYRHTIVDTGRTIGGPTIAAFEQSDAIYLLTDRSVPGIRATQRTVQLLERIDIQLSQMRLIFTEAHPGPISVEDAERTIGLSAYLTLPRDDSAAAAAMNTGQPLESTRGGGLGGAINDLADKLSGSETAGRKRGGMLRRFFSREARA